jgi:hypothetical protein
MHTSIHSTLGSSPGSLVFNRDMFLNIPLIADWHLINENLMRENQKQKCYDYVPNQKAVKKDTKLANWAKKLVGLTKNANIC